MKKTKSHRLVAAIAGWLAAATDASEVQAFRYIFQTPRRYAITTTVNF